MKQFLLAAVASAVVCISGTANATLMDFQSFNGNVGLSTDGFGSQTNVGVISAQAPAGSTVLAAYLYTAQFTDQTEPTSVTLDGVSIDYDNFSLNSTACCNLNSYRADVTSIVAPTIDAGAGGVYDFDVVEGSDGNFIDGHALVVVYSEPSLPEASVGILDGFADVTGDTTAINFAEPLDPTATGFAAEMYLGIGFSCCVPSNSRQSSTVLVNGALLTENAGLNDDSTDASAGNGNLITVGSFDDPFSPTNPSYGDDREKYDLSSFITAGDTSISIETFNSSQDDNIFLAAFYVTGEAGFNAPPPSDPPSGPPSAVIPLPASVFLLGGAIGGLGFMRRKRKS